MAFSGGLLDGNLAWNWWVLAIEIGCCLCISFTHCYRVVSKAVPNGLCHFYKQKKTYKMPFTSSTLILRGTVCRPFLLSHSVYTLFSIFYFVSRAWMDLCCACTLSSRLFYLKAQSLLHALLSMHKSAWMQKPPTESAELWIYWYLWCIVRIEKENSKVCGPIRCICVIFFPKPVQR